MIKTTLFSQQTHMKKLNFRNALQYYGVVVLLLITPFMALIAQQDVKLNGRDVGSWFERNWMWVGGAIVILIIIAFAGRGNNRKKTTTTVVKDDAGRVKSVTTTEVKE
jgi:hypothetical protein